MDPAVRTARFADLDAGTLYALLRLRMDVFVVEQHCAYPELDGRDGEPGTRHLWLAHDGAPAGYLRVLTEPDGGVRIGRVCTAPSHRGAGIAARLLAAALDLAGGRVCVLDAQSYLVGFYRRFGFAPTGPEYVDEDGIPHVPMRRPPTGPTPEQAPTGPTPEQAPTGPTPAAGRAPGPPPTAGSPPAR